MRVIIYVNFFQSGSAAGGIETYTAALIKALGELTDGNDEYIIIGPYAGASWLEKLIGPNQTLIRLHEKKQAGFGRRAVLKLRKISRRIDQVSARSPFFRHAALPHANLTKAEFDPPLLSNGYFESLNAGAIHFPFQQYIVTSLPSIFNPHDLQHLHLPQFFSPESIWWRESLYPAACRFATRVAVASDWVATDICSQYGISRNKLAVIPWGAATGSSPKPQEEDVARVRAKYKLPAQFAFYPAVAWPHKNHARLVEAMHLLAKKDQAISLVLSGADTPLTPKLKESVQRLGLGDKVRFLGLMPGEDMRPLYKAATVAVVPTLFEAVSGPVAEAWQEGTPVACSDLPQLRQQADGAAHFFDPYSPASIASSVLEVLTDAALRARIIEKGHAYLSGLSWRSTATQYRALYREVVRSHGSN